MKHHTKHLGTYFLVVAIAMFFSGASAFAQGRSAGHAAPAAPTAMEIFPV